jgi:hypothetical protein
MGYEGGYGELVRSGQPLRRPSHAPELLDDPRELAADASLAGRIMAAFAASGATAMIRNAGSQAMLLRHGDLSLPVTVEDATYGHTYVASPHSAYVLYARDEIDIVEMKAGRTLAKGVLGVMDALFRAIGFNRTVHLDNWMLSTNLHGDWRGEGLPAMRSLLTERFDDRFVVLRSLDPWSCPELLEAARADGWVLMPSRQIWVTGDMRREWKKRNSAQNDRRALNKSGLTVEEPGEIATADAERIADLYHQLYIGRYSALNPVFTPCFVQESARLGLLDWRLARAGDGRIMAACGMRVAGGIATVPLLGYDLSRPRSEALYPIASYLASHWAMERGLRFNGSAGAAHFKQLRGARSQIEYMAVYARHLSPARQAGLGFLARSLNALMVPMLKKQGW